MVLDLVLPELALYIFSFEGDGAGRFLGRGPHFLGLGVLEVPDQNEALACGLRNPEG